ncbi:hypothetical protein E4U44_002215 [Claviceps purpurea]|nr:hypothetical protein E4U44_002215 [Claviceps purpurea]
MTPGFVHHMPKRTAAAGTSHVGPWSGRRSVAAPLSAPLTGLKLDLPRSQAGINDQTSRAQPRSYRTSPSQRGTLLFDTIWQIDLAPRCDRPCDRFTSADPPHDLHAASPSTTSALTRGAARAEVADTTAVMASSLNALKNTNASPQAALDRIVVDPRYHHALALLKTARNGAVYGTKVRFPHALVMIFLFRSGTFRQKTTLVLRATKKHAFNLARFATIYKATMLALRYFGPNQGKEGPYDAFLGGLLGGYIVFGQRSPRSGKISSVSQQIVIYIFARVVLALARIAVTPGQGLRVVSREPLASQIRQYAWPAFASLSWGMVMQLFKTNPGDLQSSLRSSMTYIYQDCDEWDSLRTLLWHNK